MTEKKRKTLYWVFKDIRVIEMEYGTQRTIGAGGILILIVILVIFRKSVFNFMSDKLKLKHAPPIVSWLVMLVVAYVLLYINQFIRDLTTVFWMGLIGCAIGTILTYIAENIYGKKDEK